MKFAPSLIGIGMTYVLSELVRNSEEEFQILQNKIDGGLIRLML